MYQIRYLKKLFLPPCFLLRKKQMVASTSRMIIAREERYANAIMADSMMFSPFILFFCWILNGFFQIGNTIFQIYQLFFEVFGFQIAILTIQDFFFHVVGAIAQSCEVIKKVAVHCFFLLKLIFV